MRRLLCLLLLPVALARGGAAQPAGGEVPLPLQLFAAPERWVVAVGQSFGYRVEAVALPSDAEGEAALVAAFRAVTLPDGAFEVVRAESLTVRRDDATGAVELARAFTLRARAAGALTLPSVALRVPGARTWATRPQTLHAYRSEAAIYLAAASVVPVVAEGRGVQRRGSAFLVGDDALVTAFHVVQGARAVRVLLPDGRRLTTRRAWALDPARDVAVLYLDPGAVRRAGLHALPLALDHDESDDGVMFTAGWPGGVQRTTAGVRYPSVRFGEGERLHVTANRVRPGDSGGPLLDAAGRVIGVVVSGRGVREPDLLREDVCLAADPRPALARRLGRARPGSLPRLLTEAATTPQAQALEAALALLHARQPQASSERLLGRLQAAVRGERADPSLPFLAGSVLDAVGEREAAAAAYREALARAADYFPAAYALAHHHYRREDYAAAADLFARTQRYAPFARLGALGLAHVHTARLDYAKAEAALGEVLDRDPDFAPALFLLAAGHLARGNHADAEALAARLDRLDPERGALLRVFLGRPLLWPPALHPLPRAMIR